jgi:hypothetical protein
MLPPRLPKLQDIGLVAVRRRVPYAAAAATHRAAQSISFAPKAAEVLRCRELTRCARNRQCNCSKKSDDLGVPHALIERPSLLAAAPV